jgi:hypothetical protein
MIANATASLTATGKAEPLNDPGLHNLRREMVDPATAFLLCLLSTDQAEHQQCRSSYRFREGQVSIWQYNSVTVTGMGSRLNCFSRT